MQGAGPGTYLYTPRRRKKHLIIIKDQLFRFKLFFLPLDLKELLILMMFKPCLMVKSEVARYACVRSSKPSEWQTVFINKQPFLQAPDFCRVTPVKSQNENLQTFMLWRLENSTSISRRQELAGLLSCFSALACACFLVAVVKQMYGHANEL